MKQNCIKSSILLQLSPNATTNSKNPFMHTRVLKLSLEIGKTKINKITIHINLMGHFKN